MKKVLLYVLIGVLCVLQVLSLVKINSLVYEINSLKNSYASAVSQMQSQIAGISSNIENSLREQASLIEAFSYEYGAVDYEAHTVPVTITVIPKAVTAGTAVSLSLGEENVPLVRVNDAAFRTTLEVDLFEEYGDPVLWLRETDEIRTEAAELYLSELWRDFLPGFYVDFSESLRYTKKTETLSVDGYVIWQFYEKGDGGSSFERFRLIVKKNGAVLSDEDVTSTVKGERSWADVMLSEIPFKEEYKASEGDVFAIYAVAEDEYGYRHECLLEKIRIADGEAAAVGYVDGRVIYDREDAVLWPGSVK
jgi:hypothetical protein